MIKVSEVKNVAPTVFKGDLQEKVYYVLKKLSIEFERVDSDEVITMEDCEEVNKKLDIKIVKTLFLCNRQKTDFYLFIMKGDKQFCSKQFSNSLGISRVSFAPSELMESMLGTKIGATTVLSSIVDNDGKINIVFDKSVLSDEYYGCSDGTTTGYIKLRTDDVVNKLLPFTNHSANIIQIG